MYIGGLIYRTVICIHDKFLNFCKVCLYFNVGIHILKTAISSISDDDDDNVRIETLYKVIIYYQLVSSRILRATPTIMLLGGLPLRPSAANPF